MCYHVAAPSGKTLKQQIKSKEVTYTQSEIFHISGFVRPYLPVTLNQEPQIIQEARWKLIPFWVKDEPSASKYANTLNAEGESIFEKASYKPYIVKNRGLLYVNGFFEPHKKAGKKESENYFVYTPEKEILTLGIVWAEFNGYPTFSIITTAANDYMEEIHNVKKRMPLIISPENHEEWLHSQDPVEIKQLIQPWKGDLQAHQVKRVTAARGEDTNVPEIQLELFD